jgi:hypothetical protein
MFPLKGYNSAWGVAFEHIWFDYHQTMANPGGMIKMASDGSRITASPTTYAAHQATVLAQRLNPDIIGLNVSSPGGQGSGQEAGSMWRPADARYQKREDDLRKQDCRYPICNRSLVGEELSTTKKLPTIEAIYICSSYSGWLRA